MHTPCRLKAMIDERFKDAGSRKTRGSSQNFTQPRIRHIEKVYVDAMRPFEFEMSRIDHPKRMCLARRLS
jgi:hypothetical protein